MVRYGFSVLDHRREQDVQRQEERARPQQPAPALQFGTLGWASAMGNQAVARIARETAEEEIPAEAEAAAAEAMPPELLEEPGAEPAGAEPAAAAGPEVERAQGIPEDLPEELPA